VAATVPHARATRPYLASPGTAILCSPDAGRIRQPTFFLAPRCPDLFRDRGSAIQDSRSGPLSGDYAIVLPLLLTTVVSTSISRALGSESVYETELRHRGMAWTMTLEGRQMKKP
jgi:hypothetical protein